MGRMSKFTVLQPPSGNLKELIIETFSDFSFGRAELNPNDK